jgi:spore coat polysaccharide biosynthesis protein SpsF
MGAFRSLSFEFHFAHRGKMKTSAFIQVRMKSERLPGKALLKIDGVPVLERVISSLARSKFIKEVIICTTSEKEDDLLEEFAVKKGIAFFRGDVENVLKRFYGAVQNFPADHIVRLTGDCPTVTWEATDLLIEDHIRSGAEYSIAEDGKAAIGIFPQVITQKALQKLMNFSLDFNYSEYMVYYFTNNPHIFSINVVSVPNKYHSPGYRLTLDYEDDQRMFEALFVKMREANLEVNLHNVLFILKNFPEISKLNAHLIETYKNIYDGLMKKIAFATKIVSPL